jgi:SIR2-like protein
LTDSATTKVDTNRIGFFIGAGASIEFGIPSMTQMTTTFEAKISKKPEKELFNTIYKTLAKVYGRDNVDLEAIMSVISGLKEEAHLRDNIGELGLFLLERKGIEPKLGFRPRIEVLDNLEQEFKKHIRNNVAIKKPKKISLARKVYLDFFKQLGTVTNSSTGGDSNQFAYTAKWPIFTTNYDNVIEDFWVRDRNFPLDLGFENSPINNRRVMKADEYTEKHTAHGNMPLIKLHGSVNWVREMNDEIVEHPLFLSLDDVRSTSGSEDILEEILIYPLSQKQLYFTPFIQLFRILEAELLKRDLWIIIGYSFRDIIIRTMFEKSMEKMPGRKQRLLLVHPHANEQVKPLFQPHLRDQLTCMDIYFAKHNYEHVNKEITKVLLSEAGT